MAFVVFEGLDGSGKSSLMAALEKELKARGLSFHRTREPGGTPLGDQIRDLILKKGGDSPTPRTELLLYEASRAQHVDRVIRPQLQGGAWVLSDRFSASSVAFQAGGREIPEADVHWLNRFATAQLEPDLTVLLDLDVEEARRRRQSRQSQNGEAEDRIESEADAFHERVRHAFLKLAAQQSDRWLVLGAQHSPENLLQTLMSELRRRGWLV